MGEKLFVGNLSFRLTQAELEDFVFSLGVRAEEVVVIEDRATGQSRGFGFVRLADDQDCDVAVHTLSEQLIAGRLLLVRRATSDVRPGRRIL